MICNCVVLFREYLIKGKNVLLYPIQGNQLQIFDFFNFILYELYCLIVCIDGPIIVGLHKRYHRDQRMNDPTWLQKKHTSDYSSVGWCPNANLDVCLQLPLFDQYRDFFKQCVLAKKPLKRKSGAFSAVSKIAKAIFYLSRLNHFEKDEPHFFLHLSLPVKTTNCCNEITQACHAAF